MAGKELRVDFSAGRVSSDGGVLLLAELDKRLNLSEDLAACLKDKRDPLRIQHSLVDLIRTRLLLIGLGYEDCDDADFLRHDPLLLTALGRLPESGHGLPSQPTLSRLENGLVVEKGLRWRDLYRLSFVFLERFEKHYNSQKAPKEIILEIDATDDETYGHQQLSFFNKYYDKDCYLPYLIWATVDDESEHLLGAVLRPGNSSNGRGALGILKRIVKRLKVKFSGVRILLRLDAGFAVPEIYQWAEARGIDVDYAIRFGENNRLLDEAVVPLEEARRFYEETKKPLEWYSECRYQADGWPYRRRLVMKITIDEKGKMIHRFILTTLTWCPQAVFNFYNERGDFENRIKEMKLSMKSGRTSCTSFKANQFRLILYAASYLLFTELKRFLEKTSLAKAQVETIRLRLLKLAGSVKESVRRVWVQFSKHFPLQGLFTSLLVKIRGSTA